MNAKTVNVSHAKQTNPTTVENAEKRIIKTAAKKKAKASPADQVAKMRQAIIDLAPTATPSELLMVPLERINCAHQVRTVFDEDGLAELASDIAARGVLQPILLRPIADGRFLVIAGERRVRACRLAKLDTIPAIVGEVDDSTAKSMQLAENIQREDLNLKDSAAAVRQIYNDCESVTETARRVGKSKAWVSKRLTVTCEDLSWDCSRLLEDGLCDDLEIILTLNKIIKEDWTIGAEMLKKFKAREAGRQSMRDALNELPGRVEARLKEVEAKKAAQQAQMKKDREQWSSDQKKRAELAEAKRLEEIESNPRSYILSIEIDEMQCDDGKRVDDIIHAMKPELLVSVSHHLEQLHTSGIGAECLHLVRMHAQGQHSVSEIAAFAMGMLGKPFDMSKILKTVEEALRDSVE